MTNKYLDYAIAYAMRNPIIKLPRLCAVLVMPNGNKYIGYNQLKTHPFQEKFKRNSKSLYLHAEIDAIVNALRARPDIRGADMYVARVLKDGTPALAKPCEGCERALIHFGIKNVEWTE